MHRPGYLEYARTQLNVKLWSLRDDREWQEHVDMLADLVDRVLSFLAEREENALFRDAVCMWSIDKWDGLLLLGRLRDGRWISDAIVSPEMPPRGPHHVLYNIAFNTFGVSHQLTRILDML